MLEEKLNELNIFALRDLARKTGVNSPTSKRKDELIKGIIDIVSGKKQPEEIKSKQGRPPKVFGYDYTNVLNLYGSQSSTKMVLNQQKVEYESENMKTAVGWLELVNNNSAILWVQKNLKNESYFVASDIIKNYNVKTGDRVVAEISLDENKRLVKEIFNVNGCPITQFSQQRINYKDLNHIT